jgi:lipase
MGGYVLTRLAAERPDAFAHLFLIDPVIMPPEFYIGAADEPVPDPADHPVARRRSRWDGWEAMNAHFASRPPYAHWQPDGARRLLPLWPASAADGEGWDLACPPALEASVYQNALRTNPYDWLGRIAAPVSVIRARSGERSQAISIFRSARPRPASVARSARYATNNGPTKAISSRWKRRGGSPT